MATVVNTATVSSKAEELKTLNSSFKSQVEALKEQEAALSSMWEGDAKAAFQNAFKNDSIQMNNFYNAIEKYVSSLQQIVAGYEKAEAANAEKATSRSYSG